VLEDPIELALCVVGVTIGGASWLEAGEANAELVVLIVGIVGVASNTAGDRAFGGLWETSIVRVCQKASVDR
jgi:hypothetical protein